MRRLFLALEFFLRAGTFIVAALSSIQHDYAKAACFFILYLIIVTDEGKISIIKTKE